MPSVGRISACNARRRWRRDACLVTPGVEQPLSSAAGVPLRRWPLLGLGGEKVEPPHAFGRRFDRRPPGCLPPPAQRLGPPHRVFLTIAALHGEGQIVVGHLNFKATRRRLLGADDVATRAPEAPTNDGVSHTRRLPNAVPLDVTDKSQNLAESLRLGERRVLFHGTDGICYAGGSSVWAGTSVRAATRDDARDRRW